MENLLVDKILEKYYVEYLEVLTPQKGYRNSSYPVRLANGEWVNLIAYKLEPGILEKIKVANQVSNYLHAHSLSVRYPIDSRILQISHSKGIKYVCLYNYLPGHTIPWEAYTKIHIKLLGQTMAQMHKILSNMSAKNLPPIASEYSHILKRMANYFEDPNIQRAINKKLGLSVDVGQLKKYINILRICENLPNQQALHMDFVRGNILFEGNKISGILDFEKAGYGHRLLDIARTLAFLLVDCKYKEEAKVRKYFLTSGYIRHGKVPLSKLVVNSGNHRINVLEELINMFLLHDFYKFLRHNPYESLEQNEHFVRTKQYLLERVVIHAATVVTHI